MRETATRNYRGLTVIDRSLVHSVTTNAHNDTWGASIVAPGSGNRVEPGVLAFSRNCAATPAPLLNQ
jgi:hypothetical protein